MGDRIVRQTQSRSNKGKDAVGCLPGARVERVTERIELVMTAGKGGCILVRIGTNNAQRIGATAIVKKYRNLLKRTKQARFGQIIMSGILPVIGESCQGYMQARRMSFNALVMQQCKREKVGFVDLWD